MLSLVLKSKEKIFKILCSGRKNKGKLIKNMFNEKLLTTASIYKEMFKGFYWINLQINYFIRM